MDQKTENHSYPNNLDVELSATLPSKVNIRNLYTFLLLIIIGLGSYYLGTLKNNQGDEVANTISSTPTPLVSLSPSSTPVLTQQVQNGKIVFEGTKAGYRLEYPALWKATSEDVRGYEFVTIESPDFQVSNEYPVLEKGYSISVDINDSDLKTIDDYFNSDTLTKSIARNKIKTTVGGIEAIQYDFGYETHTATQTELLKDGRRYTIQYRYVDTGSKQNEWNTYEELLKSFRVN